MNIEFLWLILGISVILHIYQAIRYNRKNIEYITLKAKYSQEIANFEEKIHLLEVAKGQLSDSFRALSADALQKNNQAFLDLAKSVFSQFHVQAEGSLKQREIAVQNLVEPIHKTLGTMQTKIEDLEKTRVGAYESLRQQITSLMETQKSLRDETINLTQALKSPTVRGRWGEIQLKRVVELAGLSDHCDFTEQVTLTNDEDVTGRPDMIVHLPGQKNLIVDAKVPLNSYLSALETSEESNRLHHMQNHARHIRNHVNILAKKQYWSMNDKKITPEFTIMFLPGDTFLSSALEVDPSLIEDSIQKRIIITTPPTLIALLHAVAYSWRQESLTENARHIRDLGAELYKRMGDMSYHISKLGSNLDSAVQSYNKSIGSIEARILPTARKFKDLQVVAVQSEMPPLVPIETQARSFLAPEMKAIGQDEEKVIGLK